MTLDGGVRSIAPAESITVQHLLLTRFNVPFSAGYPGPFLDEQWLSNRVRLFDQFCFPSVMGQECAEFTWLIFCHGDTPVAIREQLASYERANVRLVWADGPVTDMLVDAAVPEGAADQWLATTRFDSDDALACDFFCRLREAVRPHWGPHVVNFINGYQWNRQKLYWLPDDSNPFTTLVDRRPRHGGRTILTIPHPDLARHAPIYQVKGQPAWMQVVHGENFENRVVGVRVPSKRARHRFSIDPRAWRSGEGLADVWPDLTATAARAALRATTRRSSWHRLIKLLRG